MKDGQPKEYWINVYRDGYVGSHYQDGEPCEEYWNKMDCLIAYRIHVKMDGGYNKRKVNLFPQRFYGDGKLIDWMGF